MNNASEDSIVFPVKGTIRSGSSSSVKHTESSKFIENMIENQCTGWNSGMGKILIDKAVYDISACDIEHMTRLFVLHGMFQFLFANDRCVGTDRPLQQINIYTPSKRLIPCKFIFFFYWLHLLFFLAR
jgi:hypothetical protein